MAHEQSRNPRVTVDGILIEHDTVLLVRRDIPPFRGSWVLPGGHVEYGERTEKALKREMKEELGITVKIGNLIGVYSDPKRDPRGHRITVAYLMGRTRGVIRIDREASEYRFFSLNHLPKRMGFDHRIIVKDAIQLVRTSIK